MVFRVTPKANGTITLRELKAVLDYDPVTGIFTWLDPGPTKNYLLGHRAGGRPKRSGYIIISINGVGYGAHHLAYFYMIGCWPMYEIDHIDLDRTNNKFNNLRPATRRLNQTNKSISKRNNTGVKGLMWSETRQRWKIYIRMGGGVVIQRHYLNKDEALAMLLKLREERSISLAAESLVIYTDEAPAPAGARHLT